MIEVGCDRLGVLPEQSKELGHLLARRPLAEPGGQLLVAGYVPVDVVREELGDGIGISFGEASIERLYQLTSRCSRISRWHGDRLRPRTSGSAPGTIRR